jgi:hypothetical protein
VTAGMPRYEVMHLEIQPSSRVPTCTGGSGELQACALRGDALERYLADAARQLISTAFPAKRAAFGWPSSSFRAPCP